MQILFVCLGNICRSPLADGLLRQKVELHNLNVQVDSAGTSDFHTGENPDSRMIATAKARNTEIGFLKAREFQFADFRIFDKIYVMDKENMRSVLAMARTETDRQKVQLILDLVEPGLEVPDPYYGDQSDFENVYDLLDQATEKLIELIKSNNL